MCLFLMPASRKQFFPFLEEKFPRLARQYRGVVRAIGLRAGILPRRNRRAIRRTCAANTAWTRARNRRERPAMHSRPNNSHSHFSRIPF